jgi:hypothetical protein
MPRILRPLKHNYIGIAKLGLEEEFAELRDEAPSINQTGNEGNPSDPRDYLREQLASGSIKPSRW